MNDLLPALPKARTAQKQWVGDWFHTYPDERLRGILGREYKQWGSYTLTCSDVEAYDVLSVVQGKNAILLLAVGVRSRDGALEFLASHGLDDLIVDNSALAQEALNRNIPAKPTLEFSSSNMIKYAKSPESFMDAVEANGVRVLREMTKYPTVPEMVLQGQISLSDIKYIGATRLVKASRDTREVTDFLRDIHRGKAPFSIMMMKKVIIMTEKLDRQCIFTPLRMAKRFGAELILGLRYFDRAVSINRNFDSRGYTMDEQGRILSFFDDLLHYRSDHAMFTVEDVFTMFDSGVSGKEAAKGLNEGKTALQVSAIAQDVAPVISTGWL